MVEVARFGVGQNGQESDSHRGVTTHSQGPVEGLGTPRSSFEIVLSHRAYYYHGLLGDQGTVGIVVTNLKPQVSVRSFDCKSTIV